ncbi:MAG: phosphatidylglycerophosphatase A [Gammaproteobacteria bacterium]|nr:phosphatidylglycerophosphatase A [Gammaproteobacteria bacterium]
MFQYKKLPDGDKQHSPQVSLSRNPIQWVAFGFGSGLAPVAPGTFGTVAAIPLFLLINGLALWQYLAIVLILLIVGIWVCGYTARRLGVHDHPAIVWDEIVGYLITMIAAPSGWLWIFIGFVLFRLFDIWKPWPIGVCDQRVGGGFGIMVDDVLAACYAFIGLQLLTMYAN